MERFALTAFSPFLEVEIFLLLREEIASTASSPNLGGVCLVLHNKKHPNSIPLGGTGCFPFPCI